MVTRQNVASTPAAEGLTIIGEGITVNGRINGEEDLRVEGRVEGSIALTETVHVAESGVVVATIEARDVVVSGVVVGNVSATNSVSLDPGAKLVGDISAPRLIIADGASFRGNVAMTEGAAAPARSRATTAASSTSGRATVTPRKRSASGPTRAATSSSSSSSSTGRTSGRSGTRAATAARTTERATPRVAAIRPPKAEQTEDEVTVVVRHSALSDQDQDGDSEKTKSNKKSTKKAPPRGRVPKRGKRGVNRR